MYNWKKIGLVVSLFATSIVAVAQASPISAENNNDLMRSNGKIYVVMTIALTILAGLLIYLMRLDRKIGKLENGDDT